MPGCPPGGFRGRRDGFLLGQPRARGARLTSTPAHEVKLLGAVTIAGQAAWLLQDSRENSVYVAANGKPYILRAVGPPPGEDSANLAQWNAVRIPGRPPASQVVSLSQLMR
jgi:hypothetical protein